MKKDNPAKEDYRRLRQLSVEELWSREVAAFDAAGPGDRLARVAVVRAVGVVMSESGSREDQERARLWLRGLLHDPAEKVRRYAMNALPKLGADAPDEAELLSLLEQTESDRERRNLGKTLEKIGGRAALDQLDSPGAIQKLQANVARLEQPGAILLDRELNDPEVLPVHLFCRRGLEELVESEFLEAVKRGSPFRLVRRLAGVVDVAPTGLFALGQLYSQRCFSHVGWTLGTAPAGGEELAAVAEIIASKTSRRILETFTDGPVRYRLEFAGAGHRRAAIRELAEKVFTRCPTLLNDARDAQWQIVLQPDGDWIRVELTPRLRQDPRLVHRCDDVPAASHPPLAAAMARLADLKPDDVVWDPFCGSGLELIERAMRGGVGRLVGTDIDPRAIEVTHRNVAAAKIAVPKTSFDCADFRDVADRLENVSLIITNPPMGRRVPIADLPGLMRDLFTVAEKVLRPGGQLIFANPRPVGPGGNNLSLAYRKKIDLGGFAVHLEKYVRTSGRRGKK